MAEDRLGRQIAFIKEIDGLKYIERRTRLFHSDRRENDAEHSWHLALMALVLAEHSDAGIDILKVLKMVLIHDIVEIDTGDIFIHDTVRNHVNSEEEMKAARRIFGLLPEEQATELISIWEEFETGETNEAKFARAMDRLEPILQNSTNNGGTWREYNIEQTQALAKTQSIARGSQKLWAYAQELMQLFYNKNDREN